MFARQHWYVAGLRNELEHGLFARVILDEPIVLFRSSSGELVAFADRCPHRRYPLSKGTLDGDRLVCGYHGLTFDCEGHCVAIPGQSRIPSRLVVRRYPLVERGEWIWIWMGEEDPNFSSLPDAPWLTDNDWTVVYGMEQNQARYDLLVENLLDLSHLTYVHADNIGTPEVAASPITTDVDDEAGVVTVSRSMYAVECPPYFKISAGLTSPIDRHQRSEYRAPAYYVLHIMVAPANRKGDADRSGQCHMVVLHGITPCTAHSTYDFWAVARDFSIGDESLSDYIAEMETQVVLQDVEVLNVQERSMSSDENGFEVNIRSDAGAISGRRLLKACLDAESSR